MNPLEIIRRAVASLKGWGRRGLDAATVRRWPDGRSFRGVGEIHGDAGTIAGRAAAFVLNNPNGARLVDSLVGNLVGTGIVPRPAHPDEAVRKGLAAVFLAWTDAADVTGVTDFYGVMQAAVRDMVTFGEALFVWDAASDGAPQIVRLHPDQLDRSLTRRTDAGGVIVQGIEFDGRGRRVAYWLRSGSPGDLLAGLPLAATRHPASEVIHLFRPLFPGQVRGLSWLAPVLLSAKELDELIDAMLVRAKIAAMHVGFMQDASPDLYGAAGDPREQQSSLYSSVISGMNRRGAELRPGAMLLLPVNTKVEFNDPPDQGNVPAFIDSTLRMIAAGVGVTYEQLTGDYSKVNYSSARASLIEFRRFAEGIQHTIIVHQFCRPVWDRFVRWQVLSGGISAVAYQRDRAVFHAVKWLPPAWPWVDPLKDAQAAVLEIDNLLRSRSEVVAERGYDIEALDEEIAADAAREGRLGLPRRGPAAQVADMDTAEGGQP